ncbi:MAG: DUF599 domain-containing protein [Acidobacteria bacterium]|nr:MAG: DUF599 domain-containing protein [Acidobacteriota bacterium]REK00330.1 MAG: DUF599 domain-containing protein [Acidobacteriota bacterium]
MQNWLAPFDTAWDVVGFAAFLLVFPIYHTVYPYFAARRPGHTARGRVDALRHSWIEGLIERGDVTTAAQQTRNLTMVNSILVSSALILLGITVNLLVNVPQRNQVAEIVPGDWSADPDAIRIKLCLLIVVFAAAFSFCMTALRHLGHFVLIIGADPRLVSEYYGSAADYFADLINRASHRYTLGVRSFYATFPLLAWLFDSHLFVAMTLFWGFKFIGFQDFRAKRFASDEAETEERGGGGEEELGRMEDAEELR